MNLKISDDNSVAKGVSFPCYSYYFQIIIRSWTFSSVFSPWGQPLTTLIRKMFLHGMLCSSDIWEVKICHGLTTSIGCSRFVQAVYCRNGFNQCSLKVSLEGGISCVEISVSFLKWQCFLLRTDVIRERKKWTHTRAHAQLPSNCNDFTLGVSGLFCLTFGFILTVLWIHYSCTMWFFRPKMQYIQNLVQDSVKEIMSKQLLHPSTSLSHHHQREKADHFLTRPSFIASCSAFGPKVCLNYFRFNQHWLFI